LEFQDFITPLLQCEPSQCESLRFNMPVEIILPTCFIADEAEPVAATVKVVPLSFHFKSDSLVIYFLTCTWSFNKATTWKSGKMLKNFNTPQRDMFDFKFLTYIGKACVL